MTSEAAPEDRDLRAWRILTTAQIQDLRLINTIAIQPVDKTRAPELLQDIAVTLGQAKETARVLLIYKFRLYGPEKERPTFMIEANFGVVYQLETLEGITADMIEQFGQSSGIFHVWPYWREYVQSTTVRMGLPPLRVPLMRPAELNWSQADNTAFKPRRIKRKFKKKAKRR